jgi:hypothetical protein
MINGGLRSEYEQAVSSLRGLVAEMRGAGYSPECIARTVHDARRKLAGHFKERTPEPLRSKIYARTLAVYGDALGPTIERLRADGKNWNDIIESAIRPGPPPAFGAAD